MTTKTELSLILKRLIIFLIPLTLVVVFLLAAPSIRNLMFIGVTRTPEIAFSYLIQWKFSRHSPSNFTKINSLLEKHLDLVNSFAPGNNTLLPGLIDNAEMVMKRALLQEDFSALQPFLQRLVDSHPKLFDARLWLARALTETGSSSPFEDLEIAVKLAPADERPYRIALIAALKLNSPEKLKKWCDRYKTSQFGGSNDKSVPSMFTGARLRDLAIDLTDINGDRQIIPNAGLQLNENRAYDFSLQKSAKINQLRLHMTTVPGIGVDINRARLYRNGRLIMDLKDNLIIIGSLSFLVKNNTFVTVARGAETFLLQLSSENLVEVDRITLDIDFRRLDLLSPAACLADKELS